MMKDFASLPEEAKILKNHPTGEYYIRLYRDDRYFYGVYKYDGRKNLFVPEKMFFCQGTL